MTEKSPVPANRSAPDSPPTLPSDQNDLIGQIMKWRGLLHDIQSPIQAVILAAELLQKMDGLTEEQRLLVQTIYEATAEIDDILQPFNQRPQPSGNR